MTEDEECRLDDACRCLDLERPSGEEWFILEEEECRSLSSAFRSLADPNRVRIMEILYRDDLYVCLIQHLLGGIKYSRLSYHLDILKKKGFIESARNGNFVRYSLTDEGRDVAEKWILDPDNPG